MEVSMKRVIVLGACLLLLAGCARRPEPKFDKMVSIKVTKGGEIFYNKRPVSVQELGDELNKLDRSNTGVCYHREAGNEEPHPVVKEVLQKVIDAKLAIKLSEEECP
jgi:biopolymer transport protein ExbD